MSDKATWKEQIDNIVEAWRAIKAAFKLGPPSNPPSVYEARARGREYCQTEGSDHYQGSSPEPLDLIISQGYAEGFCLGGAIKYASRYQRTRELGDLRKAVDMLHILCGVVLSQTGDRGP